MHKQLIIIALLLGACTASPEDPQQIQNVSIEPYLTSTLQATPTPNVFIDISMPVLTSTPHIYTVESGDTISQIAEKFKISENDLRAANPDVNPNTMSIGLTLVIPDPNSTITIGSTPTPVPLSITQAICHPPADSGLYCFALIQNNTTQLIENPSAKITLFDEENNPIASQSAFALLDIIQPNESLPVYAFFPDTLETDNIQVQLLTAMESSGGGYLPAILDNTITQVAWNGKSAQLSGQIYLPAESQAANRVWVAATAYDRYGQIVGVKRWEGGAIQPETSISFSFSVSSLRSAIETVEFAVEAIP